MPARNRQLGAGYDYQWDVAAWVLLACALGSPDEDLSPALHDELTWLGPIERVGVEGTAGPDAREDITLWSANRSLELQVKERDASDNSRWKKGDLVEVLDRIARRPADPERRIVFVTNGQIDPHLRTGLVSASALKKYYTSHFKAVKTPKAGFLTNTAQVALATFLAPTETNQRGEPIGGLGNRIALRFNELGVTNGVDAYIRFTKAAKDASIALHGTEWSIPELRDIVLHAAGLTYARRAGTRVTLLIDYLKSIPAGSEDQPSWAAISGSTLWDDAGTIAACEAQLTQYGRVALVGPSGAGKTTLARRLGYLAWKRGSMPVYWDFDHLGGLPTSAVDFFGMATAAANVFGARPMAILEGVVPGELAPMCELAARAGLPLVVTCRSSTIEGPGIVALGEKLAERGQAMLLWHLAKVKMLGEHEQRRVLQSIDWADFTSDLKLLSLALATYDYDSLALPIWRIDDALRARLRPLLARAAGLDDVLCLVAALGRYGMAADLNSVAACLGMAPARALRLARRAEAAGVLAIAPDGMASYWHASLARHYWDLFRQMRGTWARTVWRRVEAAL